MKTSKIDLVFKLKLLEHICIALSGKQHVHAKFDKGNDLMAVLLPLSDRDERVPPAESIDLIDYNLDYTGCPRIRAPTL